MPETRSAQLRCDSNAGRRSAKSIGYKFSTPEVAESARQKTKCSMLRYVLHPFILISNEAGPAAGSTFAGAAKPPDSGRSFGRRSKTARESDFPGHWLIHPRSKRLALPAGRVILVV